MPAAPGRRRSSWVLLALLVLLLAGTGCQVRLSAAVDLERDGSGVVRAAMGLDGAALDRLGDPATRLRLDDLRQAGWRVEGPRQEADGRTWIRVAKPFADPREAAAVVGELSGPAGPFRELRVERSGSRWRTETSFSGVIDLSRGLAGLLDPAAAELLGTDLALDAEGLRRQLGPTADQAVTVELAAGLPGAAGQWQGVLGEEVPATLSSSHWNLRPVLALGAAAVLGVAALAAAALRGRRR